MNIKNQDVKRKAAESRVWLWEIAQKLGITDSSFSRLLRTELSREKKKEIFDIIERIKAEHATNEMYWR